MLVIYTLDRLYYLVYIVHSGKKNVVLSVSLDDVASRPITHWVVSDLNTAEGRAVLYSAIKQLVTDTVYCV